MNSKDFPLINDQQLKSRETTVRSTLNYFKIYTKMENSYNLCQMKQLEFD